MVKARREANLAMEPLRSERGGDLGEQDFERATGRSCRRGRWSGVRLVAPRTGVAIRCTPRGGRSARTLGRGSAQGQVEPAADSLEPRVGTEPSEPRLTVQRHERR